MDREGRETVPDRDRADEAADEVCIGRVAGVHGLKGELKVDLEVDPDAITRVTRVWLRWPERDDVTLTVLRMREVTANTRPGVPRVLLQSTELADRSAAERLPRDAEVWALAPEVPPREPGLHDTVGFSVVTVAGDAVGTVVGVEGVAQLRLVIERSAGDEVEIPAVEPILVELDFENQRIVVDPPEGLL